MGVAPFAGAWIEITRKIKQSLYALVAPFAGAWIEIGRVKSNIWVAYIVAPFAGAWIEIQKNMITKVISIVAPFAGAWIEIVLPTSHRINDWSLPSRERGLKSY